MSQRANYSARGAIAKALDAYKAAEQDRQDAEQRARSARDAAAQQATIARDRAIKAAQSQAAQERGQVARLLAEVDQRCQTAERVLSAAGIPVPPAGPVPRANAPAQSPDQAFTASYNRFVDTNNSLVDAFAELDRVRNTLFVRATRKIGLPPL